METINDFFKKSLALYDEISKTGEINVSKTADYKARTPYLADLLQKELWNTADYTKILEVDYIKSENWFKIVLPIDFMSIKKIILSTNYDIYNNYKLEKDGNEHYLYIKAEYSCMIRIQYKPYPTTILTIDDNIQLDTITAIGLAYGLCRYFAMAEQNDFVESICNAKFNEIKFNKVRVPAQIESITDVNGGDLNGISN